MPSGLFSSLLTPHPSVVSSLYAAWLPFPLLIGLPCFSLLTAFPLESTLTPLTCPACSTSSQSPSSLQSAFLKIIARKH